MSDVIHGYRLEWRPGDYCFYTPESFALEGRCSSARIHGLYASPQPQCDPSPAVYKGRYWLEPRYAADGKCPTGFVPLYLGTMLHEPFYDEMVLLMFPSIVEEMLRSRIEDSGQGTVHADNRQAGEGK